MSPPPPLSASAAAEAVLRQMWSGGYPRMLLPVDPFYLATGFGIAVYVSDLPSDVAGFLIKQEGQDAAIYVNQHDSKNRQRFTGGHELGHFVQRLESGDNQYRYIDRRDTIASTGTDPDEIYANQFAASLLMPASELRPRSGLSVVELANEFRVSQEAMHYRLTNLGLPRR